MGAMIEELCEMMVVVVRMVSDRVMTVVLVFEHGVSRMICGWSLEEKLYFHDVLEGELT